MLCNEEKQSFEKVLNLRILYQESIDTLNYGLASYLNRKKARDDSDLHETKTNDHKSINICGSLKKSKSFRSLNESDVLNSHGKIVLVVDDVSVCRKVTSKILKDLSFESEFAENGEVACDKVENNPEKFCAIFMDLNMPVMDGFKASSYIRKKLKSDIPIIIMTGEIVDESAKEKIEKIGASHLIIKPVQKINVNEVFDKLKLGLKVVLWKDGTHTYLEKKHSDDDLEILGLCQSVNLSIGKSF